jgi:hypothetical protein
MASGGGKPRCGLLILISVLLVNDGVDRRPGRLVEGAKPDCDDGFSASNMSAMRKQESARGRCGSAVHIIL